MMRTQGAGFTVGRGRKSVFTGTLSPTSQIPVSATAQLPLQAKCGCLVSLQPLLLYFNLGMMSIFPDIVLPPSLVCVHVADRSPKDPAHFSSLTAAVK